MSLFLLAPGCLKVGFNARQSGGLDIGGATRHALLEPRTSIIRL